MFSTLHNAQDVIVELLCTAMVWAYFKSLTNRTPETLAVANEGLRQVCSYIFISCYLEIIYASPKVFYMCVLIPVGMYMLV